MSADLSFPPYLTPVVEALHWLGHSAFRLDLPQTVIYLDPYQLSDAAPAADLILCTHNHFDHYSKDDISKIIKPSTAIYCGGIETAPLAFAAQAGVAPGWTVDLPGLSVRALPAYNTDTQFHPLENRNVGFMLNINGITLYHAGDTDFIPEMKELSPDIALLPVSGVYVMDSAQAAEAALAMQPKLVIPMHYGAIVGHEEDARQLASLLKDKIPVKIMTREI